MKNIRLYKKSLVENLLLVTGTHCSGKSMVSPIVASLETVEPLRKIYYIDQINALYFLKKISLETSIFLVRHILDLSYYEQLIGRNMNFRLDDETSIFQSKNPKEYLKRIFSARGEKIINKYKKSKTYMLMDTHDGIWLNPVWKNLNIKNLKIINIFRNPIDIVNSWINCNHHKLEKLPLNQIPLFKYKSNLVPFYFYKEIDYYNRVLPTEKIIEMVINCVKGEMDQYKKIDKSNILRIEFDDFATNTEEYITKLEKFINIKKTKFTKKIMLRENCPRKISINQREIKLEKIKKKVSSHYFQKLLNFEKYFNKNKYGKK